MHHGDYLRSLTFCRGDKGFHAYLVNLVPKGTERWYQGDSR